MPVTRFFLGLFRKFRATFAAEGDSKAPQAGGAELDDSAVAVWEGDSLAAALAVLPTLAVADDSSCVFGRVDEFRALLPREPRFAKAADFLARPDLKTLPVGRYEAGGGPGYCGIRDLTAEEGRLGFEFG